VCVLSKKDNNLYIYELINKKDINTWKLINTLSQHMLYICSVDWHPQTNRIISSSHDKNIFVWNYHSDTNTWKPEIVIFETKVSVLSVKWNTKGDKFVASTGCKIVGTGYYEVNNKWWTCKKMKEHYSAVTCSKIDNSGLFIISGSTDNRIYISSAYVKENDLDINTDIPYQVSEHGELLMTIKADAWVNDVCWSKSGNFCFAATHDAIVYVIDNKQKNYNIIYLNHSPFSNIVALSDNSFIGVSFDRHIYIYEKEEEWYNIIYIGL
jgi:actin related protein 2/3 complex subunit 1A/1B